MSLESMILNEFQKLDLGKAFVSNVSFHLSRIHVTIQIGGSLVDFEVDEKYQYQITSVIYDGVKYDDKEYLDQYNDWVMMLVTVIMPVILDKMSEYEESSPEIEQREDEAKIKEKLLNKKAFELAAREQLLDFQEEAFEFEHQVFEDEKTRAERQKFRTWLSENTHIINWLGLATAIVISLFFIFSRISENVDGSGLVDYPKEEQGQSNAEIVANLRENFEWQKDVNAYARHTILGVGDFIVGDAIEPGGYVITSSGFGSLMIKRESELMINEMIGSDGNGVPSVTVILKSGDVVQVRDVDHIEFTPKIDQFFTKLTTGIWTVGVDIKAGTFDVTTENSIGNLIIRSSLGRLRTNAIISDKGIGSETTRVVLEDGDVIKIINGLTHVSFE